MGVPSTWLIAGAELDSFKGGLKGNVALVAAPFLIWLVERMAKRGARRKMPSVKAHNLQGVEEPEKHKRSALFKAGRVIAAIMLIIAVANLPYGYYRLLRLVVCSVSAFGVYLTYKRGKTIWVILLGIMALLFNPIFPIYFSKDIWIVIDLLGGILFIISLLILKI